MATSTSGLTAPCRGCLVRFLRRGDIDFEHPRDTFQLTMRSPGQARRPKSNGTLSVRARGSISLHDDASSLRESRSPHTARQRINLFSGRVVLVSVLSLPDPQAAVPQKLEMMRVDSECAITSGGDGYVYLVRVTSERLIIGATVFFSSGLATASRRRRFCVAQVRRPMRRASPATCGLERQSLAVRTGMELLSLGTGIQTKPTRDDVAISKFLLWTRLPCFFEVSVGKYLLPSDLQRRPDAGKN